MDIGYPVYWGIDVTNTKVSIIFNGIRQRLMRLYNHALGVVRMLIVAYYVMVRRFKIGIEVKSSIFSMVPFELQQLHSQ